MTGQGMADRGQRTSDFHPDKQQQVTIGVNPNPPAKRSASVPAATVPPYIPCLLGPYSGMAG